MKIGIPKETKHDEYRVALLPVGAEELIRAGHEVLVQATAGSGSGLPDEAYAACGPGWSTRQPRSLARLI